MRISIGFVVSNQKLNVLFNFQLFNGARQSSWAMTCKNWNAYKIHCDENIWDGLNWIWCCTFHEILLVLFFKWLGELFQQKSNVKPVGWCHDWSTRSPIRHFCPLVIGISLSIPWFLMPLYRLCRPNGSLCLVILDFNHPHFLKMTDNANVVCVFSVKFNKSRVLETVQHVYQPIKITISHNMCKLFGENPVLPTMLSCHQRYPWNKIQSK